MSDLISDLVSYDIRYQILLDLIELPRQRNRETMAKPHGHAARCYDLTPAMARPYANTLAGMAKSYSHVARYYNLSW